MKNKKRHAAVFLTLFLSAALLSGCGSTALPFDIPAITLPSLQEIEQNIKNLLGRSDNTGDTVPDTGDAGDTVPEQENSSLYYYYNQLDSGQKDLYNTLLAVAEDPTGGQGGQTVRISVSPESEEFSQMYHVAYGALVSDHPELFWLTQGDSGFSYTYPRIAALSGSYPLTVTLTASHPEAEQMTSRLQSAASDLLSGVDLSQSDPQVALQIHDRLIDLVRYDSAAAERGGTDLAHTAYGALVADSSGSANSAVCDGYTYAYEYLLQQAGIRCAVINGYAGQDASDAQSHSWLAVSLDGAWYETDPTWDDVDLQAEDTDTYGMQSQALSDTAYMGRLRHYLYDMTTQEMSSFTPGERYVYHSSTGWASFLTSSVHIRNQAGDEDRTGDYTTPMAPTAEGTQYSYSNLTGN